MIEVTHDGGKKWSANEHLISFEVTIRFIVCMYPIICVKNEPWHMLGIRSTEDGKHIYIVY